ncbi:hypothetical protein, partial [Methylogaea oryzae]|uniref:hypothetical protein n=1 Tax=Methylogaea oryzae TaxID=1295382 RepID=UPI001C3F1FF5
MQHEDIVVVEDGQYFHLQHDDAPLNKRPTDGVGQLYDGAAQGKTDSENSTRPGRRATPDH